MLTDLKDGSIDGYGVGEPWNLRAGPERMVVFQGDTLLPWLTACENVVLAINSVKPGLSDHQKRAIALEHPEPVGVKAAAGKLITHDIDEALFLANAWW